MFLWVRLVLDSLESAYTPEDLRQMVTSLPSDLTDLYERIIQKMCDSRNSLSCTRATAILRWIACVQRPIRLHELLHALAHTSEELNPGVQNVPVPMVLELCKPLVEQHPDGTINFVHFSVQESVPFTLIVWPLLTSRRYLQSEASVISVSTDAHCLISMTCVATLSRGLELLDPDVDAHSRSISILHGVYGLMIYALEFWSHHVLSYAASGGDMSSNSMLIGVLLTLWSTHERIRSTKSHNGMQAYAVAATMNSKPLDTRLQLIAHLPVSALVYETLQLRLASREEVESDGNGKSMSLGTPTDVDLYYG
jgi:hypothetical protein